RVTAARSSPSLPRLPCGRSGSEPGPRVRAILRPRTSGKAPPPITTSWAALPPASEVSTRIPEASTASSVTGPSRPKAAPSRIGPGRAGAARTQELPVLLGGVHVEQHARVLRLDEQHAVEVPMHDRPCSALEPRVGQLVEQAAGEYGRVTAGSTVRRKRRGRVLRSPRGEQGGDGPRAHPGVVDREV